MTNAFAHDGTPFTADVIVIGGGFGGCYALHEVRRRGYVVKLLEAGSDFGGVWCLNKYPGARVDSETPLYQLGLPKVYNTFNFTERFPASDELQRYFSHLEKTLHLKKDTVFDCRITGARYDVELKSWNLSTDSGLVAVCRHVIFATGSTNKRYIPHFPGLEAFQGNVIHPQAWPENLNLTGKRIGVIGQGASGLQIVQELAKKDCKLAVFVRNPCIAIPMGQRSISRDEAEQLKNLYGGIWQKAKYASNTGYAYDECDSSFNDFTPVERQELYEQLWSRGGYAFFASLFDDYLINREANAEVYAFWAKKVRERIKDPVKRDIMAPVEQFQWIGAKRPSLEIDYYEMIDRPNVGLVDLKRSQIQEFVHNGIKTDDGELHELDLVISATGYDAVTGSLYDMNICDKAGVVLKEKWCDGIKTYLGIMVPGLPNAFLLYGPQAPTSLANGPPFLELQVEWMISVLEKMKQEAINTIEVSEKAATAWSKLSQQVFETVLLRETPSWWSGSNVPGKRQEPLIWAGGMRLWWNECKQALQDWSKFECKHAGTP